MGKRQNFGLNKKVTPGNINIDKIVEEMKKEVQESFPNETTAEKTPVEVHLRFRKGNEENADSSFRWKTTVHCGSPGFGANPESSKFDVANVTKWGEAVPLFDDADEPVEGPEGDFDEIIYSKLAKLNETQNITGKKAEGKIRDVHRFLNLAFKFILIGIFGVILYALYNANVLRSFVRKYIY